MNKTVRKVLTGIGVTLGVITLGLGMLAFCGAISYTSRCAHIREKTGISCELGDTLSIDELASFSNYDERSITGITGGEGEISDDGESIKITKGSGLVTVNVYAHNKNAPEHTRGEISVLIREK